MSPPFQIAFGTFSAPDDGLAGSEHEDAQVAAITRALGTAAIHSTHPNGTRLFRYRATSSARLRRNGAPWEVLGKGERVAVVWPLAAEVHDDVALADSEAHLRALFAPISGRIVVVVNVFRHVATASETSQFQADFVARRERLVERIRRFNALAVRLSHDLGLYIADANRVLGIDGAPANATDHRHGGARARDLVAIEIARVLSRPELADVGDHA